MRNGNNKGGSVQLKPSIIENVHDLVNVHRKQIGLEPFVFKENRNKAIDPLKLLVILGEEMNETYSQLEIDDAIRFNNGGSIRVKINAGMVKIKCACNCGGYVPVSLAMQGWKFIRGHKNTARLNNQGQLKNGSSNAKPIIASEVYETYASRITMDIANVEHEMGEITKQAEVLTTKLRILKEKHNQLKQAEIALKPLFEKKTLVNGVGA